MWLFPFVHFIDSPWDLLVYRLNNFNHSIMIGYIVRLFTRCGLPRKVYRRYAAKARLLSTYEVAKSGLHSESLSAPTTRNSLPFLHFSNTSLERSTRTRIFVKSCVHTPRFRRSRVRPKDFFHVAYGVSRHEISVAPIQGTYSIANNSLNGKLK